LLEAISWHEFEAIVEELGEHRGTRIAYSKGTLEIVLPLPEHAKAKVVISDLLKVLLDELDMPWESLGPRRFDARRWPQALSLMIASTSSIRLRW
jgi:hypothetical protein